MSTFEPIHEGYPEGFSPDIIGTIDGGDPLFPARNIDYKKSGKQNLIDAVKNDYPENTVTEDDVFLPPTKLNSVINDYNVNNPNTEVVNETTGDTYRYTRLTPLAPTSPGAVEYEYNKTSPQEFVESLKGLRTILDDVSFEFTLGSFTKKFQTLEELQNSFHPTLLGKGALLRLEAHENSFVYVGSSYAYLSQKYGSLGFDVGALTMPAKSDTDTVKVAELIKAHPVFTTSGSGLRANTFEINEYEKFKADGDTMTVEGVANSFFDSARIAAGAPYKFSYTQVNINDVPDLNRERIEIRYEDLLALGTAENFFKHIFGDVFCKSGAGRVFKVINKATRVAQLVYGMGRKNYRYSSNSSVMTDLDLLKQIAYTSNLGMTQFDIGFHDDLVYTGVVSKEIVVQGAPSVYPPYDEVKVPTLGNIKATNARGQEIDAHTTTEEKADHINVYGFALRESFEGRVRLTAISRESGITAHSSWVEVTSGSIPGEFHLIDLEVSANGEAVEFFIETSHGMTDYESRVIFNHTVEDRDINNRDGNIHDPSVTDTPLETLLPLG